jgi:F-type H+-transporting ATPase subunit c
MSKKGVIGLLTLVLVLGMASLVFAEGGGGAAQASGLWVWSIFGIAIACGFGIGVAALGTGIGMGWAINGALLGGGKIMTTMIIGLALVEALCIYALVITLILAFRIPDLAPMLDAITKSFGS